MRPRFARLTPLLGCAAALAACAGPPVPSPLEDEPICLDYETAAHEKMVGAVRSPVKLTVLEGKKPVFTALIRGRRQPSAPPTPVMLPDTGAEYTVEWAQCAARQPERKAAEGPDPGYRCDDPKVYKTATLVTKKGDPASRTLRFALPPDATCHIGQPLPVPAAPPDEGHKDAPSAPTVMPKPHGDAPKAP